MLHRDVGVDLRGGDVGVAEQALDTAQVGAVLHHVGGATVAQHVRAGLADVATGAGGAAHHLPHPLAGERASAHAEEQRPLHASAGECGTAALDILVERLNRAAAERDDALLVALAADLGAGLVEMQVLFAESDDLADAQAAGVEELEDGVVAEGERGGGGSYVRIAGGGGAALEHLGRTFQLAGLSMVTVGSCAMRLSSSSQR